MIKKITKKSKVSFPFSQNKLIVSKPSQRRRKEEKKWNRQKKVSNFPHSGFQNLRRIVKKKLSMTQYRNASGITSVSKHIDYETSIYVKISPIFCHMSAEREKKNRKLGVHVLLRCLEQKKALASVNHPRATISYVWERKFFILNSRCCPFLKSPLNELTNMIY